MIALAFAALALAASGVWLTGCTSDVQPVFLQLRWCALEGSSEAGQDSPGDLVSTHRPDGDALLRATEMWDEADIGFVSVVAERGGSKGIPVIRDPDPIRTQGEQDGDIRDIDTFESNQVALECHRAWRSLAPELEGPVVVTARRFIIETTGVTSETLAGTSQPAFQLQRGPVPGGGERGDDLCGEPRQLSSNDVFEIDGVNSEHVDVGWLVIAQPSQFSSLDHRSRALAHELGHILFLGHGNGADDNGDGEGAGVTGPRRFDEYCDPLGTMGSGGAFYPREDLASTGTSCESLMHPRASCTGLTALQVEQARAAAVEMPGCSGTPCKD